jgi:hypothetical protein
MIPIQDTSSENLSNFDSFWFKQDTQDINSSKSKLMYLLCEDTSYKAILLLILKTDKIVNYKTNVYNKYD